METIFYNIVALMVGTIILLQSIVCLKEKLIIPGVVRIILSLLFIALGVLGFILPEGNGKIVIFSLLGICVVFGVFYYLESKNTQNKSSKK